MKKTGLFLIFAIAVLLLTGCGGSSLKSETEIQNDIASSDCFEENYPDFYIREVDIVKRQTDTNERVDKIYAVLTIENNDKSVAGNIDMLVEYGLYNDGWIMDSCKIDYDGENGGAHFYPLRGTNLSHEEIVQVLADSTNISWEDVYVYDSQTDLEKGLESYSLTAVENHPYMQGYIDVTISFEFMSDIGQWKPSLTVNNESETWSIEGIYFDPIHELYIEIGNNGYYVIAYNDWYGSGWGPAIYTTLRNEFRATLSPNEMGLDELFAKYSYGTSPSYERRIEEDGYSVIINSSIGFSYYDCEYVAFDAQGEGWYDFLFIGKDFLAAYWTGLGSIESDDYNKTVTIYVSVLEKIS